MCFYRFVARLGDLDLDPDEYDGATPLDILIDRVIIHERYLHDNKQINDIALLKLKKMVNFNSKFKKIFMFIYYLNTILYCLYLYNYNYVNTLYRIHNIS